MLRTYTDGELNEKDAGKNAILVGWVAKIRNLGALVFLDLRDRYGITQVKIAPELYDTVELKNEYCIQVEGKVQLRSDPNPHIKTGNIELVAQKIKVFSKAEQTPFIIADKTDALEETRLKSRYLDLRRPALQHNLMVRQACIKAAREYLEGLNFMEIETPTLIMSTPEGARDYLVPSRMRPGKFYALPQSPQIFKQLLMVGGFDRYYQLARCYRDEDQRADRQPEFTQIDVEMSFIEREDILNLIEGMVDAIWDKVLGYKLPKFKRIEYKDAIGRYGSDKPDMRYEMLIEDVTPLLSQGTFEAFKGKPVKALLVKGMASKVSRKRMDEDNLLAQKYKVRGVSFFKVENGQLTGSLAKFYTLDALVQLKNFLKAEEGDVIIVGADQKADNICIALGALRCKYAAELGLANKDVYIPCFVLDWPLFGMENGEVVSLSNPFTRPRDEDLKYLDTDPTKVLSYAYDTVMNGEELSSGSLRIYDSELQDKVFKLLGLSEEDIKKRFGFFVDALKFGTPPHGGFAFGVERTAMLLCKTDNARDVVAFPKNLSAIDMMTDAPSDVPTENLDILGIQVKEKK